MPNNELHLYGTVGESFWDEEYFTANTVRDQLASMSGDIIVRLNSGGGVATEGQAIYTMLVDWPGKVTVVVDAVAASSASLIAMAGDEIVMRKGAWMLIHDPAQPFTEDRGTEADHIKLAEMLGVIGNAYADIYAARGGMSREEARRIMTDETVLDGQLAVDLGFATSVDETVQSSIAARFDYRFYAHAPQELREASKSLGRAPRQAAVMAMIAGRSRIKEGEPVMAAKKETAAPDAAKIDDIEEKTPAVEAIEAELTEAAPAATAAAAITAERARTRRILEMAALGAMPDGFAQDHIAKGTRADAVLDLVMAKRKETADVDDLPMAGRETPRILRDERETVRTGMTMALHSQLASKDPDSDVARPYMTKSLVEMAAICAGYKGPIRSAGDKISVFMDAAHSRSDFPGIFENALNKSLLERYEVQQPTFKAISKNRNFRDFRVHPLVRGGDMPKLQPVAENGEIKFGTFGERRETAILSSYGIGLSISRQMMIDDDLGAIADMIADYGSMVADFEEETFYTFMLAATLSSDSGAIWQTGATRTNLAGSGTAITVAALGAGRAAMRKQTTVDGKKMNLAPAILLVGPDKETEADQLVTSITPNAPASVNPFSGRLQVLSSAQLSGNAWYLFADPNRPGGSCFVHGYLDGATAPRLRTEEPFGTQGVGMTVEHDFGVGANDFRGTYKNPGA